MIDHEEPKRKYLDVAFKASDTTQALLLLQDALNGLEIASLGIYHGHNEPDTIDTRIEALTTCIGTFNVQMNELLEMLKLIVNPPIYESNPDILGGTLVFAGTRVPVNTLFSYMLNGSSLEEFHQDFPTVSRKLIQRALNQFKVQNGCNHKRGK